MDPKMDSGCELSGGDIDPDVFDPLAYRSPSEIVAIVDQLLCHFVRRKATSYRVVVADL